MSPRRQVNHQTTFWPSDLVQDRRLMTYYPCWSQLRRSHDARSHSVVHEHRCHCTSTSSMCLSGPCTLTAFRCRGEQTDNLPHDLDSHCSRTKVCKRSVKNAKAKINKASVADFDDHEISAHQRHRGRKLTAQYRQVNTFGSWP